MAFTKVVGAGIHTLSNITSHNINSSGIITATKFVGPMESSSGISTFYDLRVTNDLTVDGTTTTLDTTLIGVDRVEVGANSDTIVGLAVTQSGTADILNLYDGSTEVFSVADGGAVSVLATGDNKGLRVHTNSGVSATNNELRFNTGQSSGFTFMANSDGGASNERLRITSGGDVGINTTAPQNSASVQHYTSTTRHQSFQSTDGDLAIVSDNNINPVVYVKGTGSADLVNVFDNTNEVFTIKDGGNVGINENSPDAPLHITGGLPHIRLENSGTSASANDIFGQIDFKHNDSSDAGVTAAIKCVAEDASGNSFLAFYNGDGGNADERLRITSDGNIEFGVRDSSTAITSGTIKQVSLGKDYWNGDKGHYGSLRLLLYDLSADDAYGFGISNGELEIQSQSHMGFYAGGSAGTSKRTRRMYIANSGDVTFGSNTSASKNSGGLFNMSLGGTFHDTNGSYPKLSLWHDGTDHMGFGVSSNQLDYILTSSNYDHVFYGGNAGTTELLRIKGGTGKVGIGTDTPSALLNVNTQASGTTDAIVISRDTYGTVGKFINSTGALVIESYKQLILSSDPAQGMTAAGSNIQFVIDSDTKAFLDSSGNLGIGTDNPSAPLNVHKINGTIAVFGDDRSGDNSTFECIKIKNDVTAYPAITNDSSNDTLDLRSMGSVQVTLDSNNNSVGKYFRVTTNGEGSAGTELFRIDDDGDIGIGNDDPYCKLAIRDTAEFTAYAGAAPNSVDCLFQLWNNPSNETASDHASMQFAVNGGTHNRVNTISAVAESAGNRKLAFTFCTDEAGSRAEKLRITGDGQVRAGAECTSDRTGYRHQFSTAAGSGDVLSLQNPSNSDGQGIGLGFWARNTNNAAIEVGKIKAVAVETQANSTQKGKLQFLVNSAASMTTRLTIVANGEHTISANNNGNPVGLTIQNSNTASHSHARLRLESQNQASYSNIYTDHANSALRLEYNSSNSMYIKSNGNVGLGTNSPATKLHIQNGDLAIKQGTLYLSSDRDAAVPGSSYGYQVISGYKVFSGSDTYVGLAYVGHSHSIIIQYMCVENGDTSKGGSHGSIHFHTTYGNSQQGIGQQAHTNAMNGGRITSGVSFSYCNGPSCGSHGNNYVLRAKVSYTGTDNFALHYTIKGISSSNMYV